MKEVTMHYAVYKNRYCNYKTVKGSYDAGNKTITVLLPDDVEYVEQEEKKPEYIDIIIPDGNIDRFNGRAYKVRIPYGSDYRGYITWIPCYWLKRKSLRVKKDCKFTVKKYIRDSKDSFKLEDEAEITAEEMQEAFECSCEEPEIHIPEHLEPVHTEVLKELIDDE